MPDGNGGGQSMAPAAPRGAPAEPSTRSRLVAALRGSVWTPVIARASAIFAGMLALGGIGAASTLAGTGVPVHAVPPVASSSALWIAPDRDAHPPAPGAPTGAPSGASTTGTGASPGAGKAAGTAADESAGVTADGKVVLNSATAEQLMKLPRVGPKRAQAILALRQKLGRFRQVTDLLRVRGIGRKTLRLMLPELVLDGPEPQKRPSS